MGEVKVRLSLNNSIIYADFVTHKNTGTVKAFVRRSFRPSNVKYKVCCVTNQFAASRDGRYWWRPDRRARVSQPPLGDYGGGMTWSTHHVVSDGDRIHYYYGGMEGIHGDKSPPLRV